MSAPRGRVLFLLSRLLRQEAQRGRQTDNENSQDPEDGCVLGPFISRLCSTIDLFRRNVRCNSSAFWAYGDTTFRSIATAFHTYIHYCVLVAGFIHPLPFLQMITSFLPTIVRYFARMFPCQFFQRETEEQFVATILQFSEFRVNFMVYKLELHRGSSSVANIVPATFSPQRN
jgi:hypothetical protein